MIVNDYYGDGIKWFVGVVVDGDIETNRVRVRIFGIHPFEEDGIGDGPAYEAVSNGDLPWATVIFPVNDSSENHNLKEQDWVFGFFADGDNCQQPVVVGKIGHSKTGTNEFKRSKITSVGETGDGLSGNVGDANIGPGGNLTSGAGHTSMVNKNNYYYHIPGSSNQEKAFNLYTTFFHEEMGVPLEKSKQIAAGIVASLIGESGKSLNPNALNSIGAYGIAQWLGPRKRALNQMCKKGDFVCQLNYSISELKPRGHGNAYEGKESYALKQMLKSKNPQDAAYRWTVYYERPENKHANGRLRAKWANSIYNRYKDRYQPARKSTTDSNTVS